MDKIHIKTHSRTELVDITSEVNMAVQKYGVKEGFCLVYVPHTTAGVTINENADPSVQRDIINELNKVIPQGSHYTHMEGNADAHIKSTLVGSSVSIPVSGSKLALGTWQGIYFCEFDGPRSREAFVQIIKNEQYLHKTRTYA
ncbi:MAG: secondary thiamine-phosphate synthase enzyme YjbQ [Candidatus Brocadiales bacterium]|nr:secondary thiamine-phosphate synthase enzyme YjbQ [Candidatus Brocadiales bacterium]